MGRYGTTFPHAAQQVDERIPRNEALRALQLEDVRDAPEDFDGDEDDDGCPDAYKNIVVKDNRIELKQKVFFKNNEANRRN